MWAQGKGMCMARQGSGNFAASLTAAAATVSVISIADADGNDRSAQVMTSAAHAGRMCSTINECHDSWQG